MKKKLIVVGAGGFSREVLWLAQDIGQHSILGLLDDKLEVGTAVGPAQVLGKVVDANKYTDAEFVVAIGSPRIRQVVIKKLEDSGVKAFATLVHPSVNRSNSVKIGEGTMICAGVTMTVDIIIGKHNIVNINSTIGHDCRFGDFCTVAPVVAISGNVTMGDQVEVGTGAAIRQGAVLHQGSMLGMGGVLTKDIPANQIFVGNPAKFLKEIS